MTKAGDIRAREAAEQVRAATIAFLRERLNDRSSIEWAIDLDREHPDERRAVRDLMAFPDVELKEPFRSAWLWLLESWSAAPRSGEESRFAIQRRVQRGGVDGEALRQVVELVRPWPRLEKLKAWRIYHAPPPPKVPRKLSDLVSISIEGGELVALRDVGLQHLDLRAADELADRLEAALLDGLHVAWRLGWIQGEIDKTNYDVRRVYRVASVGTGDDREPDPDTYRHGFSPVTKLLFEVLDRLSGLDWRGTRTRINHWRTSKWAIVRRLWAALARNREVATAEEVARFLIELPDEEFWKPHQYPEFAELRARRFSDLATAEKHALEDRIRRLPPALLWVRKPKAKDLSRYRHVRAAVEFRRILAAGGQIGDQSRQWLKDTAGSFDVPAVESVDFDFEPTVSTRWVSEEGGVFNATDVRSAVGKLEAVFKNDSWDEDANAARSYVKANFSELLDVFSNSPDLSAKSPAVWRQVLQLHRAEGGTEAIKQATTVLNLLTSLPHTVLPSVIDSLADWLATWAERLKDNSSFPKLWLRAWPIAVEATNNRKRPATEDDVTGLRADEEPDAGERLATAALNTPVGVMTTAFFHICPNLTKVAHPFRRGPLREMRRLTATVSGPARLQVLHRFLSQLEYMRRADERWTDQNLLGPLMDIDGTDIEIWDAVSRIPVPRYPTMQRIGARMAEVAHSSALPMETRARLGERVVYRVLLDKHDDKKPSVADSLVQQMLRLGTDRLRASCGRIIGIFVESDDKKSSPEERFTRVVKPFLDSIWPKERTLTSRTLSNYFAEIPSKSAGAFAKAVDVLERFLTPFDCWSLHEYGLYKRDDVDGKQLRPLHGSKEASALLKLLDITIGSEERAVHPLDLDRALVAIREIDPKLVRDTRFARLSALVRQ